MRTVLCSGAPGVPKRLGRRVAAQQLIPAAECPRPARATAARPGSARPGKPRGPLHLFHFFRRRQHCRHPQGLNPQLAAPRPGVEKRAVPFLLDGRIRLLRQGAPSTLPLASAARPSHSWWKSFLVSACTTHSHANRGAAAALPAFSAISMACTSARWIWRSTRRLGVSRAASSPSCAHSVRTTARGGASVPESRAIPLADRVTPHRAVRLHQRAGFRTGSPALGAAGRAVDMCATPGRSWPVLPCSGCVDACPTMSGRVQPQNVGQARLPMQGSAER